MEENVTEPCTNCTVEELGQKQTRGDAFLLLDVRTAEELAMASLEGAHHIPLDLLEAELHQLEAWRDGEIVVMCHHGVRSAMAQRFLLSEGFSNVRNLTGGIDAYSSRVDSAISRY